MTDNEIINSLKCCFDGYCSACAFEDNLNLNCKDRLIENALNLIESQKAEIEMLKAYDEMADGYADALEERAKSEAYKDLADKLYKKIEQNSKFGFAYVTKKEIENVVRELEGEENV